MKSHVLCAVVNVSIVIVFARMAIELDKWWIVLFALLFMHSSERKERIEK